MNSILLKFGIGIRFGIGKTSSGLRFAGILLMTVLFASCNFLNIDDYIDEQMKYDSIFSQKRYIEAHVWNAASKFPDEGNILGSSYTPGPLATDEAFTLFSASGMSFVLGQYTAENSGFNGYWKTYYQIIRQCNTIFARIDEASDWTNFERLQILAYNRFIRAYAYYNLVMNWGPVVLMGDLVEQNNEEMSYYDRPRDLYDSCINYICAEFEEAAKYIPEKASSIMDYGLPSKGAAYALIARLRLMHASPLYNGGAIAKMYFGTWTRSTDGKHYISQTYDPKRWAVAAAAAKRVIDLQIYSLHVVVADADTPGMIRGDIPDDDYKKPYPNGAAGIDHLRSYSEMFNGETVPFVNTEFIWARTSSALTSNAVIQAFPFSNGGGNGMCVTQKIVDAYEMVDGRLRTAPSDAYPYLEYGTSTVAHVFSGYRLPVGVSNMYVNREMRFYASIGFNECLWPNLSTTDNLHRNHIAQYSSDGVDGRSAVTNVANHPITGYVIKKFINPIDCTTGAGARIIAKTFPIIRYAEILLSYAEALNALGNERYEIEVETNGVMQKQVFFRNKDEIKNAINQVRYRSGLPGLLADEIDDADYVLEKIKKERMVEFLFENRRYFDVRRWGDYESSENEPIMGMNTAASRTSYYQRVVPASSRIGGRVVNRRMMFVPIPIMEIKRLPSFDQNPGW